MRRTTHKNGHDMLMGLMIVAPWMAGCAYLPGHTEPPEGTWACISEWSHERDGVQVPHSVERHATCTHHVLSTTGVVSIGAAQWSEKKEGTCYASGDELYGTWTSAQTVPKNDAARRFERERLGGESLAMATKPAKPEYRSRVTSRTDTEFKAVDEEGRVISCTRL